METQSYILIIEWDGNKPPTRWYSRLNKLGLKIGGDKEQSPIARREGSVGVVHQEGAIITTSESEAHSLGHLAKEMGAKAVSVGRVQLDDLNMSEEDQLAMNRIQVVLGRRGRPVPPSEWVITCLDEMRSKEWVGSQPVHCNSCGSFRISYRQGERETIGYDAGKDIFENWKNTRFFTGRFEYPDINESYPVQLMAQVDDIDRAAINLIENSDLLDSIRRAIAEKKVHPETAMDYLDGAFKVAESNDPKRHELRIGGVTEYIRRNPTAQLVGAVLSYNPRHLDMFDVQQATTACKSIFNIK